MLDAVWLWGLLPLIVTGAMLLVFNDVIELLRNAEGFRPSTSQRFLFVGAAAAVWVCSIMLVFAADNVRRAAKAYAESNRSESMPESDTNLEAAKRIYGDRGYTFHGKLSGELAPEIWTRPPQQDEGSGYYKRPGLLLYSDGTATLFSVVVLYKDDAWKMGHPWLVERRKGGKPVGIGAVVQRPLVKELAAASDYVLGVGLASSAPSSSEERNSRIADARALNIAIALRIQGVKEASRIRGISLGYATKKPHYPELEARQRSVVLVGVNASSDVSLVSVVQASAQMLTLDGVDLGAYSHGPSYPLLISDTAKLNSFVDSGDMGDPVTDSEGWVLPRVAR